MEVKEIRRLDKQNARLWRQVKNAPAGSIRQHQVVEKIERINRKGKEVQS